MRLFVAIEIAPDIRERIIGFMEQLKPKIPNARWSRPEGLHITLKFLGHVADEKVPPIQSALGTIDGAGFPITIERVGTFPNEKSPRVLWVGVKAETELARLAENVQAATSKLGFEREQRAFSPHVTLARLKEVPKKTNLKSVLPEGTPSFGTMTAKDFHLYESKLSAQGSRYIKLASFPLE
jgi:2'-5' RNA ligase